MPVFAEFCRNFRVGKEKANLIRCTFHGMRQQAGMLVDDLEWDAANRGGHHRFFLPQRFGNSEPEAFAQAILNHDGLGSLKLVYHEWRPGRQLVLSNVW